VTFNGQRWSPATGRWDAAPPADQHVQYAR
jgi:hypothetical protein